MPTSSHRLAAGGQVDFFFRSFAQDQGERAICIVLSGTGTDGTLGLKAVKEAGGMAMVQEPETARYDGMPRSAIATGLVDFVLPPDKMLGQLLAYVERVFAPGVKRGSACRCRRSRMVSERSSRYCARKPGTISPTTSRAPSSGASSGG